MDRRINDICILKNADGAAYIEFEPLKQFEWLRAGFSTRLGGVSYGQGLDTLNLGFERNDNRDNVIRNFELLADSAGFDSKNIVLPNQWHTNNLRLVDNLETVRGYEYDKDGPAIDGQITALEDAVLITYGADCTPVYLIDDEHKAIGLCHSGWKGTPNSISRDTLELMKKAFGTDASKVTALIGPSISADCYEVGYDVAEHFIKKHGIKVTVDSDIVREGRREGKYQLDLWEANRQNLVMAGVPKERVYVSGICTFTESSLMYSHRRDGNARGVMAAFMSIRNGESK